MKNKLFAVVIILMVSVPALAQGVRLNAYGMYTFDDKFDSYYDASSNYAGKVKAGFQWGAGVEYMLRHNQGIELLYLRLDTKAPTTYATGTIINPGLKTTNFDLGSNYIMLASNRYFRKPGGKVEGFGGGMLGVGIMSLKNPDNNKSTSGTKFSWGIRGGANIWASEVVGIKLQAQLLSVVQGAGGGLYFGTGGVSTGLSTYSSIYQFSLGGGLVFNLPSQKKK